MAQPDILIERDRISVVGGSGPEETNGTERGDLEVTSAQGDPASIKLNADRANLTLGGGAGNAPEGDLKVLDRNANPRVQVTAEPGNKNAPQENGVWVSGGAGRIELGNVDESGTVDHTIALDGANGLVDLHHPDQNRFDAGGGKHTIRLDATTGTISAGAFGTNPNPSPGRLKLRSRDGREVVDITAEVNAANRTQAGAASFYDSTRNKTVEIRGQRGLLKLGFSKPPDRGGSGPADGVPDGVPGPDQFAGTGTSGKIFLNDGGAALGITTVFEIKATKGRLEIGTSESGDPLFVVDAPNESVKIPQNWSYDKL